MREEKAKLFVKKRESFFLFFFLLKGLLKLKLKIEFEGVRSDIFDEQTIREMAFVT